jgi:hypothetical protein
MNKVHYSKYGEHGSTMVNCGKYFTTDVLHTEDKSKVTCKFCLRTLTTHPEPKTAESVLEEANKTMSKIVAQNVERQLKNGCILFLDSIRDYERESHNLIGFDERTSEELFDEWALTAMKQYHEQFKGR